MPTWTLEKFRRAGQSHLESAEYVLSKVPAGGRKSPALIPASAAYLAHVALECGMKARLLARGGYASVDALKEKAPQVYAALFKGSNGHNLAILADQLRIKEILALNGKHWISDACWTRIASSERPYSLRYGAEQIDRAKVAEELKRASELLDVLLIGIKSVPLVTKKRKAR